MLRNPAGGRIEAETISAVRDQVHSLRARAEELERAIALPVAAGLVPASQGAETAAETRQPLLFQAADPTLPQILTELRAMRVAVDRIAQQATNQAARVQVVDDIGDWPAGGGGAPAGWQAVAVDVAGLPQGLLAWDPWDPVRPAQGPFISLIPNSNRLSVTSGMSFSEILISSLYPSVPAPSATPSGMCFPEGEQRMATRTSVTTRSLFVRTGPDLLQLVGVVTYQLLTERWSCVDDPDLPFGMNSWALNGLQASSAEIRRRMTILSL
jgi:hypothetical protein